jgi:thioesterase domain-containing protein/acyl carrier protein
MQASNGDSGSIALNGGGERMIEIVQDYFGLTAEDSFPAPKWYFQQMLWVQNPWHPENSVYNYPLALRMRGLLDRSALERSFQEIVRRHQPLRSAFRIMEGRLIQIVLSPQPLPLPVVDLSNVCEPGLETEALRLAVAEANRPFDLSQGPLLRANLWCLGPEDHLLLLTTHHIVSDNWSMAILLRELSLLYGAFSGGQPSPLAEVSCHYVDFVRRQQQRFEHKESEYLAFWKEQLAGRDRFHYVPQDHARPESQAYHGAHERLTLDQSLTNSLKALSTKEKVSPFMILLATFQCLLCRYSGQLDVGVASCVANRQSPQVERMVGHFSNHVLFRTRLAANSTLRDVLRQVREAALTAYSYQDLPFGNVVETLDTASGDGRNNLFQVLLVLTEAPREKWSFLALDVRPLPLDVGTTPFDLIVWLKLEAKLEIDLQYNSDLFESDTIRQILVDYATVLGIIAKNPEAQVGKLGIAMLQAESRNHPQLEPAPQPYMGPRDSVESQLVKLWEAVLGKRPIGIEDDFFELGGTSLLAARLFAQIEEDFKLRIPLIALVQAPTIKKLAKVIHLPGSPDAWHSLVAIQPGGIRPPLFCVHGESGNLLMYRSLARYLGPDQAIYGLQPQGLDGKQAPLTRIEDMAACYIKEIQVIQPEGPYFLAGYCMGGTIALEMAQQLSGQGRRVALLALLDTYNWRMMKRTFLHNLYFNIQKLWFSCHHFFSTSSRKKLSSLQAKLHELSNESGLSECNRRAACAYVPKVYSGRMLHVRPAQQYARYNRPEMAWDELVTGGLEVFCMPSYPAQLVEEPFVRDLATKLRSCISESTARENSIADTDARACEHQSVLFSPRSTTTTHETLLRTPGRVANLKVWR